MRKILLLVPQNVIPAIDGGKLGIFTPMQMLAEDFDVTAVVFVGAHEQFSAGEYKQIGVNAIEAKINKKDSPLSVLTNITNKQPFKFAKYYKKQHQALINSICANWQPDVIICHHAHLASYCIDLKKLLPSTQLILREHNVEYLLVQQAYTLQQNPILKKIIQWQFKKTYAIERGYWDNFDDVLFISDEDFIQFSQSYKAKGHIIYDGTNKILPQATDKPKQNAVLFSGSVSTFQNKINLSNFLKTVWIPWKKNYPAAATYELWITGDRDNAFVKETLQVTDAELNLLNIRLLGFVNNLAEVMQQAKFFLSPTVIGAGIRIKLLEALGCSCVTFITPKDLAISKALNDGENILLYSNAETFNNQLEKAVTDNNFYNRLSSGALKVAENFFSWPIFYKKLLAIINNRHD